jgi:hypothetical protein
MAIEIKSTVVAERIPSSYKHPGIRPRRKHERFDPYVFGKDFLVLEADGVVRNDANVEVGRGVVVAKCTRQHPWSGEHFDAECVEVTLPDGRVVPFVRLTPDYVLCQDLAFKYYRGQ